MKLNRSAPVASVIAGIVFAAGLATANDKATSGIRTVAFSSVLAKPQEPHPSRLPAMCGDDLGTPHVGMPLDRAKQCVGKLKLVKEVKRIDGAVAIYNAGSMHLSIKDDRVVAFSLN